MNRAIQQIPVSELVCVDQVRKRFDEVELAGLVESVKQHGVLQPIAAYRKDDKLIVEDGERRLRAAIITGMKTVPVLIWDGEHDRSTVLQNQLLFNCQRADLRPVEKAHGIGNLMEIAGWTEAEVAKKLGTSTASVSRSLKLLKLPPSVQALVDNGQLSESTGYEISRVEGADAQERLANEAVQRGLTRDAISNVRRRAKRIGSAIPDPRRSTRAIADLGGGRTVIVRGPGLSLEALIEWLETLLSKARRARPRGIELTTFLRFLSDESKAGGATP